MARRFGDVARARGGRVTAVTRQAWARACALTRATTVAFGSAWSGLNVSPLRVEIVQGAGSWRDGERGLPLGVASFGQRTHSGH